MFSAGWVIFQLSNSHNFFTWQVFLDHPWAIVANTAFISESSRSMKDTLNWYYENWYMKRSKKPIRTAGNDWAEELNMSFSLPFVLFPFDLSSSRSSIHYTCCQWQDPQALTNVGVFIKKKNIGQDFEKVFLGSQVGLSKKVPIWLFQASLGTNEHQLINSEDLHVC